MIELATEPTDNPAQPDTLIPACLWFSLCVLRSTMCLILQHHHLRSSTVKKLRLFKKFQTMVGVLDLSKLVLELTAIMPTLCDAYMPTPGTFLVMAADQRVQEFGVPKWMSFFVGVASVVYQDRYFLLATTPQNGQHAAASASATKQLRLSAAVAQLPRLHRMYLGFTCRVRVVS